LRIITLNLNGIRSAVKKGVFNWLSAQNADVICVQEIKAQADILEHPAFELKGYKGYFHYAEKKGYSGVGIFSRLKVHRVVKGLGFDIADQEGRYIAIDLGPLWVASLYMPSGTTSIERQTIKFDFLKKFQSYLQVLLGKGPEYIICGDLNIAHKAIDLKNWRSNQKNSGFLPEERAWMDHLFGEMGLLDAFRLINLEPDQYTWWSNRGRAWEKNVGWRIDYQVITPGLKPTVKSAMIYKGKRFSDHAPLSIDYDMMPSNL
jgi:exodeoxyribonuclease-3